MSQHDTIKKMFIQPFVKCSVIKAFVSGFTSYIRVIFFQRMKRTLLFNCLINNEANGAAVCCIYCSFCVNLKSWHQSLWIWVSLPCGLFYRTTEQQQRFHEICGNLVKVQRRLLGWWRRMFALKEEKPKMVNREWAWESHMLWWWCWCIALWTIIIIICKCLDHTGKRSRTEAAAEMCFEDFRLVLKRLNHSFLLYVSFHCFGAGGGLMGKEVW